MDQHEVKKNNNTNNKFAQGKYKSKQRYSHKITYLVEKVGLLKLMTIYLLRSTIRIH